MAEHWYQKAAEIMVTQGVNLFAATQALDLGIRKNECELIQHTREFLDVLRGERNRYYKAIANDPTRSRATAVGQLLFAIDKMLEREQYDKATEAIFKLARIENWTSDQTVNIFSDLSGQELQKLKQRFQQPSKDASTPAQA